MKHKRLLSMLLTFLIALSLIPSTFAAASHSGTIGDSAVEWAFEPETGHLFISGSGDCERFASPDDQPWASVREEITEVWFRNMDTLAISDLAYWFTGCTALTAVEIPYTTPCIGESAFADCPSLTQIWFYYYDSDTFRIEPGAFDTESHTETTLCVVAQERTAVERIVFYYDWAASNRHITIMDAYSTQFLGCAIASCTCSSCASYNNYVAVNDEKHERYVLCSGCTASFYLSSASHSYAGGICTVCGYEKSSSGGGGTTSCSHSSTYTEWSGCDWFDYCSSCDELVSSGTSHKGYTYGAWQYYSATRHRRTATCTVCRESSYTYGSHSTATKYAQYSATQHKTGKYCSTCSSYIGSTSYAAHTFTYSAWSSTSETQHSRTKTCSACKYVETEIAAHTDDNNDGTCDGCSYSMRHFSVIVPASLDLLMAQDGTIYTANQAQLVNNSTEAIQVSSIEIRGENGWTIVPHTTNMANIKVDTKRIGLRINDFTTKSAGQMEIFTPGDAWKINASKTLFLDYGAVVSASSEAIDTQVLTIIFIVEWAL